MVQTVMMTMILVKKNHRGQNKILKENSMSNEENVDKIVSTDDLKKVDRMPEILHTDEMAPMPENPVQGVSENHVNKMPEWKTD